MSVLRTNVLHQAGVLGSGICSACDLCVSGSEPVPGGQVFIVHMT